MTDYLVIAPLAAMAGRTEPVTDRLERLEYARRYRHQHPGGMGEILQQVAVAKDRAQPLLIFDGLRGEAEVSYAARMLPQAAFAMLDAPNKVRLLRMLHRGDPFDRVRVVGDSASDQEGLAALGVPEAAAHFSPAEIAELLALVQAGTVTGQELRGKLKTIVEQAHVYQPVATRAALEQLAGDRAAILDTASLLPEQVAAAIIDRLQLLWPRLTPK
ncbi:MAG: ATPase [Spirulinaceae cyanobacterium SM2_1_0]|nr:ATPase [Spirulinaceae cyanobacterium SM2_1_0]